MTDAHDRRTLMCILDVFYSPPALAEGYRYSPSGRYACPPEGPLEAYVAAIKALPLQAEPEVRTEPLKPLKPLKSPRCAQHVGC